MDQMQSLMGFYFAEARQPLVEKPFFLEGGTNRHIPESKLRFCNLHAVEVPCDPMHAPCN